MRIIAGMPMYYGAKPQLFEYAKQLRSAPTETENLMWQILTTNEFLSHKFRRQHPIATYIADFYSHPLRLVVEIDGGYHLRKEQKEYDDFRDEDMHQLGITVVRFKNNDVLSDSAGVIEKIATIISLKSRL